VVLLAATCSVAQNSAKIAPTPPLGWNSWDAYGLTINETDYRANTTVLAGLKEYGWTYSVIDEGWYMQDPFAETVPARKYVWDQNGILIPSINRFPSSQHGAGFKPLADWVHAQGMKFGIHIVRGIPRQVVKENLPIANSSFRATDAADTTETCPWDEGNYGVRDTPAGQAYEALRWMGPRLHQGGLHLRSPLPADRDSPNRSRYRALGQADCSQPLARPHPVAARG
jgi:hypothetical protein